MHWDSIQNFKLFANNVLALKTKDKPSEILFHRSPAGYEWASPKFKIYKFLAVKSNISDHQQSIVIYIMLWSLFTINSVPNQVRTFRLAKLEGVDRVDQMTLHGDDDVSGLALCVTECGSLTCVKVTWFSLYLHPFPNAESSVLTKWDDIAWRVCKWQHCSAVSLLHQKSVCPRIVL